MNRISIKVTIGRDDQTAAAEATQDFDLSKALKPGEASPLANKVIRAAAAAAGVNIPKVKVPRG